MMYFLYVGMVDMSLYNDFWSCLLLIIVVFNCGIIDNILYIIYNDIGGIILGAFAMYVPL